MSLPGIDAVLAIASKHYGMDAEVRALVGYADSNFRLRAISVDADRGARNNEPLNRHSEVLLKVCAAGTSRSDLEYQTLLLNRIHAHVPDVPVPMACTTLAGEPFEESVLADSRYVRMLTYLPGRPLAEVNPKSVAVASQIGRALARIDRALEGLEHPGMNRKSDWDLSAFLEHLPRFETVRNELPADLAEIIDGCFAWYKEYAAGTRGGLRRGVIHGDANDYNILFDGYQGGTPQLSGVIDFGDSVFTEVVNESAIALAYLMMSKRDPLSTAASYLRGYTREYALEEGELACLFHLIKCRLATTVVMAAWQQQLDPDNAYYQVSVAAARHLLARLAGISGSLAEAVFREAAGLEPVKHAAQIRAILANADVSSMLDVPFTDAAVRVVDLGAGSLDGDLIETDEARSLSDSDEPCVLIGRYNEARIGYRTNQFAAQTDDGGERRTIHLGIDVFCPAGTEVRTPIDGVVHSVADHALDLDYGPTVILKHQLGGSTFYSLFGHLSRESIKGVAVGRELSAGEVVARLGARDENGGWTPHLHYQLIIDLFDETDTFIGVARASQRAVFTSNCPDPNLLLRIPKEAFPPEARTREQLLAGRGQSLSPSLSLSYREPLHIVRGVGLDLIDVDGRRYLDCVNNVCHVGHSHPKVVSAIARQAALLNTNTRYLHENAIAYAESLTRLLPEPLSVCYLVCSGSEANDLALRLAAAYTGRSGVIAIEHGYHGNLSSLIDVSSYKFDGPGGRGKPGHVELAAIPDAYRGKHGDSISHYVASVATAAKRLVERGHAPMAFIAETILSCGGQIEPPAGYLLGAYREAREAGAVCIADEVQTGFGRVGSHFWAFETQGVTPDIVTMGKPIGNGHPIAAVVTTRPIADAFANGMEYFNTYGGNPVSCAAAAAVLEIIEEGRLQEQALRVGDYFRLRLQGLARESAIIGEVRGRGLFLGVEMVRDRSTKEPAADEASYVVNRMRERGILLSTDGPRHNVIKIKPPMIFSEVDVDRVVESLSIVLAEDYVRGIGRSYA